MVHIVMGGSVEPLEHRVVDETGGKEFIPQVADHIPNQGPGRQQEQRQRVERNNESRQRDDGNFRHGFQRVKRQRSPGRWVMRKVVDPVEDAEQLTVVHQAVYSVEIGVVEEYQQQKGKQQVNPAKSADIGVDPGVAGLPQEVQPYTDQGKDKGSVEGMADLTQNVGFSRIGSLDPRFGKCLSLNDIEQEVGQSGKQGVAYKDGRGSK